MPHNPNKLISLFISFCLILEQTAFAQAIDLSHYFAHSAKSVIKNDKFRPLHLRYISYDSQSNDFKLLLDKGDFLKGPLKGLSPKGTVPDEARLQEATQELMKFFFIGLALPNDKFWVNLRPDSPDNILDPLLEKTDIGRIFLEADVQLKKDTAAMTSPQTKEGKEYWDKLYKKAGELFGTEHIAIPTITRPWIVPNEIIIREAPDNAYIYKATLKVMLEEDYLKSPSHQVTKSPVNQAEYSFKDPRLKELNEYSTQLIKETIIPKLTYEVNTSKRYAPLRQVYYSLILAQWFKQKYSLQPAVSGLRSAEQNNPYIRLIDSRDLTNLASKELYDKQAYFQQYQESFAEGEYSLQEPVYTPMGQSVRRYMSGGIKNFMSSSAVIIDTRGNKPPKSDNYIDYAYPPKYSGEQFWSLIKKELRSIKERDGGRKYFIDTERIMDDKVFYAKVEKSTQLVRVGNHQGYDLVQIEDMFFIDQAVYEDLKKGLPEELKRKTIIVPNLFQSTIGQSVDEGGRMKKFTAAAILSILHSDIAGKCVIDAGAGDGMLALVAAKLYASQVVIIDNNNKELDKARKNLENNGLKEGKDFFIITGDLRDMPKIIEQFPKIKSDIVLISNIGNWEDYQDGRGRVTNLTSLELALEIAKKREARISGIILGGYEAKLPIPIKYGYKTAMDNEYKKHRPDNDIKILTKKGFKVRPEKSQVGECISISAASSAVEGKKGLNEEKFSYSADDVVNMFREYFMKGLPGFISDADLYPSLIPMRMEVMGIRNTQNERSVHIASGESILPFVDMLAGCGEVIVSDLALDNMSYAKDKVFPALLARLPHSFSGKIKFMQTDAKNIEAHPDFKDNNSVDHITVTNLLNDPGSDFWELEDVLRFLKNIFSLLKVGGTITVSEEMNEAIKVFREYYPEYVLNEPVYIGQGSYAIRFYVARLEKKPDSKGSSAVDSRNTVISAAGGIAFNALPIQTQAMPVVSSAITSNFKPLTSAQLDAEWAQIQAVFNAGIRPSIQRLSEYTATAAASHLAGDKIDQVRSMLADMLRREEESEKLISTEAACKQLLTFLESG